MGTEGGDVRSTFWRPEGDAVPGQGVGYVVVVVIVVVVVVVV
jgi:hypothetical protein